jgi:hypothetical protein
MLPLGRSPGRRRGLGAGSCITRACEGCSSVFSVCGAGQQRDRSAHLSAATAPERWRGMLAVCCVVRCQMEAMGAPEARLRLCEPWKRRSRA